MNDAIKIEHAKLDELYLDPQNPRLGRQNVNDDLTQDTILELMQNWVLEELAVSYLESGFWSHEALLVVKEELDSSTRLVVVEGNRRLAALIYLRQAINGNPISKKWGIFVEKIDKNKRMEMETIFDNIPYIQIESRQKIEAFLGFRHVTGIKQWPSEQKARYITKLIDEKGYSFKQVMRKIGSNTPTVRHNYFSYRILLQMEDLLDDFSIQEAERRFTVMSNALKTQGVQDYLDIDIYSDIQNEKFIVPKTHLKALENFSRWLFGNKQQNQEPLFTDSRRVDDFGKILENSQAREYLENKKDADFEDTYKLAGVDETNIVKLLSEAAANVKLVLSRAHHHKDSEEVQEKVETLGKDVQQLMVVFPNIGQKIASNEREK